MPPFDNKEPDCSPRSGAKVLFGGRIACNGIESGLRALAGTPLHPRRFWNTYRCAIVWREQTGDQLEVPAPFIPDPSDPLA